MKTNSNPFVIGFGCCVFLLGDVVKADEARAIAPAKTEEISKAPNSQEAEPKEEESLSLGRQLVGYAVLALLLVWMFSRAGKNKVTQETDNQGDNDSHDSSCDNKSN